jgi:hypothetical protein
MSKIIWQCDICNQMFSSNDKDDYNAESRVVKLDIPQSGENMDDYDNDTFEFRNACLYCRRTISDAIYGALEEINPDVHENRL